MPLQSYQQANGYQATFDEPNLANPMARAYVEAEMTTIDVVSKWISGSKTKLYIFPRHSCDTPNAYINNRNAATAPTLPTRTVITMLMPIARHGFHTTGHSITA